MSNQKFYRVPFAASGDRAPIPDTVDPGGSVSYPQGFGPDYERPPGTDPLAKRVPRDETNQYIYDLTDNLRQYQLAGTPEWVTAAQNGGTPVPYDINARVLYAPTTGDWRVYRSLVTNNTVTPGSDDTKWRQDDAFTAASLAEVLAAVLASKVVTPATLAAAIQRGQWTYVTGGGTANAITGTVSPAPTAYDNLRVVCLLPLGTNAAGAVTINLNGLGAVPVTVNGASPPYGTLRADVPVMLVRTSGGYAVLGAPPTPGRLLRTTIYTKVGSTQYVQVDGGAPTTTGAGTFTPLAESVNVDIEVQGGGGGGSGCPATDSTSQSAAGGGGSGAWAIKRATAAAAAGATVTVGAGGAGGTAGPAAGASGTASSVGAIVSALGGSGGTSAGPSGPAGNFYALGGAAGVVGTSGDINLPGVLGAFGTVAGGQGVPVMAAPGRTFGGYFGTGGASQSSLASTPARAGIAGTPGAVIIKEWT